MTNTNYELEVRNLSKHFKVAYGKTLKAVDDISFNIKLGDTLGIVGESGCGKTTVGKTAIGMYDRDGGQVLYKGKDVHQMNKKERKDFVRNVQMVFQDPYASLDPRQKVYDIIAEGIQVHKLASDKKIEEDMVIDLLRQVGLKADHANRYAHEFSGGQRQRIGIARALSVNPDFLFCDEPTSALDVSIQAQIINLLLELKEKKDLTMLFIAHDLPMVNYISDNIAVMYLGNIVEIAQSDELFSNPKHPYTQALLSSVPIADPEENKSGKRIILSGEIPSPVNPPIGCKFCTRCPRKTEICETIPPEAVEVSDGHKVCCHLYK